MSPFKTSSILVVVSPEPEADASGELGRLGLTPAGPCIDYSDELRLLARIPSGDFPVIEAKSHYDLGGVWL